MFQIFFMHKEALNVFFKDNAGPGSVKKMTTWV